MKASLILVTGFLGAGKTTFIKTCAKLFSDKRLAVLVNEFGKVGMDAAYMREMDASLKEINGGSIFCSCKIGAFEDALRGIVAEQPDIIIVEASGLSDPTAVRTVVNGIGGIHYAGCICLTDPHSLPKVYETARMCKRQLSVADVVLINKTDVSIAEDVAKTEQIIKNQAPAARVYKTALGNAGAVIDGHGEDWKDAVLGMLGSRCENGKLDIAENDAGAAQILTKDISLQNLSVAVSSEMSRPQLVSFLKMFAEDSYRIKGFVKLADGEYAVNCVGAYVEVSPYDLQGIDRASLNILTVLSGHGLPTRRALINATRYYEGYVEMI